MSVVTQTPMHVTIVAAAGSVSPGFATDLRAKLNAGFGSADTKARFTEAHLEQLIRYLGNGWISGGSVTIGTGLSVNVASLTAMVCNVVQTDAAGTVGGLESNATNYIYLRQDGTWSSNTAGSIPGTADGHGTAMLWGQAVTGTGTVSSVDNTRATFGTVAAIGPHAATHNAGAADPLSGIAVSQFANAAAKTLLGNPGTASAAHSDTTDPVVSGAMTAAAFANSGMGGATAASRYVGATTGGAPSSGTFLTGDYTVDQQGGFWVCGTGGTPGSWLPVAPRMLANAQTVSYTLVLGDMGKCIEMNLSAAGTVTIPANGSVAFPVGCVVELYRAGTAAVAVAIDTDTLRAPNGANLAKQYSTAALRKRDTTEWVLSGDTSS